MNPSEINDDFKQICKDTADLVKAGQFKRVLKHFNDNLKEGDPNLIAATRMIAAAMKSTDDFQGSNRLYNEIYKKMKKIGGEEQVPVMEALLDVISSTQNIKEAYRLTLHGIKVSEKIKNTELIEKFNIIKLEIFENMPDTQKRMYTKLDKKKGTIEKKTPVPVVVDQEVYDIDELIAEFGLETYDKKGKK